MSTAERNTELIRALFTMFAQTPDTDGPAVVAEVFDDRAVWHHFGTASPNTGRYDSRSDIIERAMGPMMADSGGTWRPVLVDVRAAGDELVLVHLHESATINGTFHEGNVAAIFRVVEGKITEGVRLSDESLDAHWGSVLQVGGSL